jgi:valyl-tRNA synthetase
VKLPKVYEPSDYEADIYRLWEASEAFLPKARGSKNTYSIVMPPPNANANLHIGYALTVALEDIPARYHRMQGKATLLLPGADHAGFETQSVFEKHLDKQGKSRFDFNREELYSQIYEFVMENKTGFEKQFRSFGASCDWSRFTFTLDEKIVKRAFATFKKLWDDGLVYRGERLVNYCTFHGTGFADVEVEHKEEQGKLWHINYPLTDGSSNITVATTRPETMLGDTAVTVHPDDERYSAFIGKTVKLPLTNREIPIIADEFVDKEFGTGAVKLTPAHDQNDFEAGERHDLPMITVIGHDGKITHHAPEAYQNMTVEETRKAVVDDLESLGLIEKVEEHTHSVGHCYKCNTVIEPLLTEQWFIDMKPLATRAIESLRNDEIVFYPESKKEQLIAYLKGLKDWNISRQIAWGIPIPAFVNANNSEDWIFDERVDQETITIDGKTYVRDPDVFDTWFSSGSWPYATLDYPDSDDYKQFYPLSLMETGGEILYPWVSRMIMLGLYVTGKVPFEEVYIHGYVMAEDGAKMSKSLGNVVDPFPVIQEYGSDALRMGLIAGRAPAVNRGYDPRKVEDARNFCNKLWNIARYSENVLGDDFEPKNAKADSLADHWMLSKLHHSTSVISNYLDTYRFAEAYEHLYHLVWDDFADWYIEASKVRLNKNVLAHCLETILKLAHPFAPFVTETIWQTLAWEQDDLLITSSWPAPERGDEKKAATFEEIKGIVAEIRNIRASLRIRNELTLYHHEDEFLEEQGALIAKLAKLGGVVSVESGHGLRLTDTKRNCWLDVDQTTAKHYLDELKADIETMDSEIQTLEQRLSNQDYVKKAPKELVNETKEQLKATEAKREKLQAELQRYEKASSS